MASSTSSVVMPGSFHLDTSLPPKLDINVGAKSHFFQPPKTASSSLHHSTASTPSRDAGDYVTSRKRSRQDSFAPSQITPTSMNSHTWPMDMDTPFSMENSAIMSPLPFVNTKYELAGGLDTPTAAALSAMDLNEEKHDDSPELHLRGGRGIQSIQFDSDSYFPHTISALPRESNGRSRLPASPSVRDGLGRAVHTVVGVAGKVLEFCKATAFRGFYAGGGKGYEMRAPPFSANGHQSVWLDTEGDDRIRYEEEKEWIPGRFPEEDFIPDYMSQDHTTPPRAAKRIRREQDPAELGANWVMVDADSQSREASPSRLSHRKTPSVGSSKRRPISKLGGRPKLQASRPSLTSYAGSPGLRSDRPASFASTRSAATSPRHESPVSAEVQRHAARMRKREIEEDVNLRRFNLQLKAMIKEGREALGTKFEVEEPVDEDYGEGE